MVMPPFARLGPHLLELVVCHKAAERLEVPQRQRHLRLVVVVLVLLSNQQFVRW